MFVTSLRRLRRRRGQFLLGGLCGCCAPPVPTHTCGPYGVPDALTLTDASGSYAFNYNASFSSSFGTPTWFVTFDVTRSSVPLTGDTSHCSLGPASNGPLSICYIMQCLPSSSPHFSLTREWTWVNAGSPPVPTYFQDSPAITGSTGCLSIPSFACNSFVGLNIDGNAFGANPSSTSPFILSGTPTGTTSTTDPIGGSVTITA